MISEDRWTPEKRTGEPCRICGGPVAEYREKGRNYRSKTGEHHWSRWCVGCDYAAKACKCHPKKPA